MSTKKNILFTFDYELFLGKRSGTVERCLIEPTELILQCLDKHQIKNSLFFVDTLYLFRLKSIALTEKDAQKDYHRIKQQLRKIIQSGHRIFPHIHPHWLDATYLKSSNQWNLSDYSRYRFHNLSEKEREKVFADSFHILLEILEGDGLNEMNAYRAGGWCIQPFSDFSPFFEKYKIQYDFSVMKGFSNFSEAWFYDFKDAPEKSIYPFSEEINEEDLNGRFREFAISVMPVSPIQKFKNLFWNKYLWKTGNRSMGNGHGVFIGSDNSSGISNLVDLPKKKVESRLLEMVSVELLTRANFAAYLRFIKTHTYTQFITHPKMVSHHNLQMFDHLLKKIRSEYDIQTDFRSIER